MTRVSHLPLALLIACCSAQAALADPPANVGRLSYTEGTVSFHPADQDQWSYATLNYPVTSGDGFWTEPDAKSEIQAGPVEIRMDQSTQLDVLQLDDQATRVELPQGVANIHIAAPPPGGSVQVVTPVGDVDLTQPGTYHIDSGQPEGDTPSNQVQVTTLEGDVQIRGPRSMLEVMPGETATMTGNPPTFALQEGNATPFDDWALAREQHEAPPEAMQQAPAPYAQQPVPGQYVSPQMTGYQDLGAYGQWSGDPNYGAVWYPTEVAADWAPYRYGHWAFIPPWGWTWVDDAPWGFAPFHYGRWMQVGPRWAWVPGAYVARPVYAPALVAFIGGISIGISEEPVGWVPLGPREVFHPYYHASNTYIRNVNITNVDKAGLSHLNDTRNARFVNQSAATVVPASSFTRGDAVHNARVNVSAEQLSHASVTSSLSRLQPESSARNGRALSPQARAELPRPNVESNTTREAGSNAPIGRMQQVQPTEQHNLEQHQAPHPESAAEHNAPMVQNFSSAHPENEEAPHPTNFRQSVQRSVPTPHAQSASAFSNTSRQAPGPAIRHPTALERNAARQAAPQTHTQLQHANVPHPEQHTRIAPTPQGWQRQAAPQHEQHQDQGHDQKH